MYYHIKDITDYTNTQLNYSEWGWSLLGFEITAKIHLKFQVPGKPACEIVSMYHLVIPIRDMALGHKKVSFMPLGKEQNLMSNYNFKAKVFTSSS